MPLLNSSPSKLKVLVPEKLSPDGLALLRTTLDVDEKKGLSAEEILAIIPEYEALLVRSETKVTAALLAAAKNLKVVARAGVGVDNVGKGYSTCYLSISLIWPRADFQLIRCRGCYQAWNRGGKFTVWKHWSCGRTHNCFDDGHCEEYP